MEPTAQQEKFRKLLLRLVKFGHGRLEDVTGEPGFSGTKQVADLVQREP
jgi:hypothetical protein